MESQPTTPSPCETLVGKSLPGVKRAGVWKVTEKIQRDPKATGGTFSVGYLCEHNDGTIAFVKATDIGLLKRRSNASPLDKISQAMNEQKFERTILDICNGSNMDRVVHALDYGELETTEGSIREYIFYTIFELADGDVRHQANREKRFSLSWALNALHNLAVAVQQLHGASIAHNDIKPSNLLVFNHELQKLADLGRAISNKHIGPWDGLKYSGDWAYAAPEFWYVNATFPNVGGKINFDVRRASDLYLIGSMGFFFVTGEPLTPLLRSILRPEHWGANWKGSYEDVLPYVRDATGEAMSYFDQELPISETGELLSECKEFRASILRLCDPDPSLRGFSTPPGANTRVYDLQKFISLFNRLSRQIAVLERQK